MLYQTSNPHGGDIYANNITLDFSASINPLGPPPAVTEAMREAVSLADHYPDPACRQLTQSISSHEKIPAEFILCGNGAAELIYSFCLSEVPQKALIPIPAFSEYETALLRTGCRIIHHKMTPEHGFVPDRSFLDSISDQKPDVIFLCNPGNPSGRLIPTEILETTMRMCKHQGIRLFIDECFLDFTGSGQSLTPHLKDNPCLFILKSLTKTYAIPGIRIGYGLSADTRLLQRMSQTVQPWNVSLIAQEAGIAALNEKDYTEKSITMIRTEREWLTDKLQKIGFEVCPSDANYILFNAPAGLDKKLQKRGIAIRNCSNFAGLHAGWYRIAVRSHEENAVLIHEIQQSEKENI